MADHSDQLASKRAAELGLRGGAGDENRTRTISLGTRSGSLLSAPSCYSCTSGPVTRPAGATESGPVRTVCETNVIRRVQMNQAQRAAARALDTMAEHNGGAL
jgi:hypothetical protein